MSYLEELLPEFRKGAKITNRSRDKSFFVQMRKDNGIVNSYGEHYSFDFSDFINDGWELYQEPIDWQYIIDNKCLCWFWDDCKKYSIEYGFLGFLAYVQPSNNTDRFEELSGGKIWKNCHPVRRDEITFYEDREE